MLYGPTALERAMRIREVMLRTMSGEINWIQASDILGMDPRSLRRWKARFESHGYDGLLDRRRGRPSGRRTPAAELERVLRLYRDTYTGFNVRHFHQIAQREHAVTLSYTTVKTALQAAGLVRRRRSRGRHRRRREPKACRGEMLHLDGSPHAWLALCPDEKQTLIALVDDATSELLYGRIEESESTDTVMAGLKAVFEQEGLPMTLYTDRASWAAITRRAGEAPDPTMRTQVGRALDRLGIEHIRARSPQARGRSERANRTLQDRLVNELRVAGIRTVVDANRYLEERFRPEYNRLFARPARDPASAFVGLGGVDLNQVLCHEHERVVGKDNTVVLEKVRLQIAKQRGRRSCEGMRVLVRRHLDASHTVWRAEQCLGRFDRDGNPLPLLRAPTPSGVGEAA